VDVSDKKSYERALSLDRNVLLGRRVNIRPTRTKEELARIVKHTKETVAEKIRMERQKQESTKPGTLTSNNDHTMKISKESVKDERQDSLKSAKITEKKQIKSNRKRKVDKNSKEERQDSKKQKVKEHSSRSISVKEGGEKERKLTKKERNRRAAIIMSKSRTT
jgi:hypothetical protein